MVDFAGWNMPVQYPSGILAEHRAVRTTVGIFDLSHMGRFYLRGPDRQRAADYCVTRDLSGLAARQAAYALLCDENGAILDDVIVYLLQDEVLIVVNASNREKDAAWIQRQIEVQRFDATLDDRTFQTALVGVQGPAAVSTLQALTPLPLDAMAGYSHAKAAVAGEPALVARTGYTGEDGFEVLVPTTAAESLWQTLLDAGALPCGLGARDTLRLEAGFPLYGHEILPGTNPYEADLGWTINLKKERFASRAALQRRAAEPRASKRVGLLLGAGPVPRAEMDVSRNGSVVGAVTSGTFSPSLEQNVAMAYVPADVQKGDVLHIQIRQRDCPAEATRLPLVPHRSVPASPRGGAHA